MLAPLKSSPKDITLLPAKFVAAVINESWWGLCHVAEGHVYRNLHDAMDLEEKAEREHRSGRAKFAISVNATARLMVVQNILTAPEAGPLGWDDVCDMSPRVVLEYGIAARLRKMKSERAPNSCSLFSDVWCEIIRRTGTVNVCNGSPAVRLMQAERIKYNEPINVPYIVAIDYARDVAKV